MNLYDKLKSLERVSNVNYWSQRIMSEMLYVSSMSKVKNDIYNNKLEEVADFLLEKLAANHSIIRPDAIKAEEMLAEYSVDSKKLTAYCVSHAHIDMNWMWGFQETASVTVDTFRTVLNLMKEYPDFTFSQSQASVYKIIEKYAPEMIDEIKARVHEGRWELAASTWVETDKNMPNGESLSRHILYTKRYLAKLFDIDPTSIKIDFEPDTFGHNINVPEILQNGGVDYYYHCRGYDKHYIYTWRSPSGKDIIVHRDPKWYNAEIDARMFCDAPQFCQEQSDLDILLKVYGVGDHGGGPTRRDVERITDMATWPLYPTIKFSTYSEYFTKLAESKHKLPVVDQELNFVFTGCYSTQSRIKMSNRLSEDRLYDSEMLSVEANILSGVAPKVKLYSEAWKNVLFNHFHDILPGSGVIETREYAMGLFQDTLAYANTNANTAMQDIISKIDTSSIEFDDDNQSNAEGGGVGFAVSHESGHHFPQAERGRGKTRVVHLFNTTMYDRSEPVEVTIWDYPGDLSCIAITDSDGNDIPFQFTVGGSHYWGHNFIKLLIDANIPAFGFNTYIVKQAECKDINAFRTAPDARCDYISDANITLDNENIEAIFDSCTMALISLKDKSTGQIIVTPDKPSCMFRYIQENTLYGMTAWRVGPYMKVENLNLIKSVKLLETRIEHLRKFIRYEIQFESSNLQVKISLDKNSKLLDFDVQVDWHQIGTPTTYIPQLNFFVPVAYTASNYKYDIPFGTIIRKSIEHDVPANSFMQIMNDNSENEKSLIIVTDSKYAFRGTDNSGAVTLIRSSYDPDPYPELGKHHFKIGVGLSCNCNNGVKRISTCYNHEIAFASGTKHTGTLPLKSQLLNVCGNVMISALKNAEDDNSVIVRLSDLSGKTDIVKLCFLKPIAKASFVDINENENDTATASICGNIVEFEVPAHSIVTLKVAF